MTEGMRSQLLQPGEAVTRGRADKSCRGRRASESRWPIATPQASASCPLDSSTPDAGDLLAGQANAARDQCRAKCLLHLGCKGGSYPLTIPARS